MNVDVVVDEREPALRIDERAAFGAERLADATCQRGGRVRMDKAIRRQEASRDREAGIGAVGRYPARVELDAEHPCRIRYLPIVADLPAGKKTGRSDVVAEHR